MIGKFKKPKIKGFLDGVEDGYVYGWAFNEDNPDERLEIVIYADGEPVAEGVADEFREDLLKAGIGDGKYGFKIKLPEMLMDEHEYIIKAKVANYEVFLSGEIKYSFKPTEEDLSEIEKLMFQEFDHEWFKQTYNIPYVSSKIALFKTYKELVKTHKVSPNPEFNEKLYLLRYKDVADAVKKGLLLCGFAHYVAIGKKEGRSGNPITINELDLKEDLKLIEALFDEKWYLNNYKEVNDEIKRLNITPFEHYIKIGLKKQYSPNSWFDEKWYASFYEDVKLLIEEGIFLSGFEHYLKVGRKQGRIGKRKSFDIIKFKFPGAIDPIGIGEINSIEMKLSNIPTVLVDLDEPRVNFVLPTFDTDIMFGGYISMVEIIRKIKNLGFNMRFIICEDSSMSEGYFWYNLENLLDVGEADRDRISFVNLLKDLPIEVSENDVFIAYSSMTALTAYNIARSLNVKKKGCIFNSRR